MSKQLDTTRGSVPVDKSNQLRLTTEANKSQEEVVGIPEFDGGENHLVVILNSAPRFYRLIHSVSKFSPLVNSNIKRLSTWLVRK